MSAYCGLPVRLELSLPGRTLDLMDAGQGFRVASLELGFPAVREDVNDAPAQSGTLDFTAWFGARAVTISGSIVRSASGSRTHSLMLLAPYMDPAARPTLTYQLEDDVEARTMTLRAANVTAPLNSISVTTWSASWKCPLGLALGTELRSLECGPSWLIQSGRPYSLTFNRTYPAFSPGDTITVVPDGDYPAPPTFTLWGPIAGAEITVADETAGTSDTVDLLDSFTLDAGRSLVIDCGARTIVDDTGANVFGDALDGVTSWPALIPDHTMVISFYGTDTAGSTRLFTTWFDRWLI